jgi:hypothetical protein
VAEVGGTPGVYVVLSGDAEVKAAEEALSRGDFDNPVWAEDVDVGVDVYVFGNEAKARKKKARRFGIPVTIFNISASDAAEEI